MKETREVCLARASAYETIAAAIDESRSKSDTDDPYREAARERWHRDGECEIDDDAVVSEGLDPDAYVMAWVRMTNEQAGVAEADGECRLRRQDRPEALPGELRMTDIFVFGSNIAGRHGAGAAKFAAQHHGAIYGQGIGLQGSSYGIPTKDAAIRTLPLPAIDQFVGEFIEFAKSRPDLTFDITPIGCGLAGYKRAQIKPMFEGMPDNCRFNATWNDPD
jgi:hypothetical protein